MSIVTIKPSHPKGSVILPPSKSAAHRALICSFLAGGGKVSPIIDSMDMRATSSALTALKCGSPTVDCIESGSTLRFIIPVAAAMGKTVTFTGQGSLQKRPLDEYIKIMTEHGVNVQSSGTLPFAVSGQLRAGHYEISGGVSSQYITGLLLALPLLDGDSAVVLTSPLQSKPYVDMTIDVMASFGVTVKQTDFGYLVKGNQKYKKTDYFVEGDWSQAAFFMAMGAIGGDITINGVNHSSCQGDMKICDVVSQFGAEVIKGSDFVRCRHSQLHAADINAADIPDMVPSIAVMAAFADGTTHITGAERLRYKESDRIESIVYNLTQMGVKVKETPDGMIIEGAAAPRGTRLKGFNDHRIVMAFSAAAMFAQGDTIIDDAQSIKKSYPSFFDDYKSIGGKICLQ